MNMSEAWADLGGGLARAAHDHRHQHRIIAVPGHAYDPVSGWCSCGAVRIDGRRADGTQAVANTKAPTCIMQQHITTTTN